MLVGQERLELSRPKALVPKTSVSAISPPAHWSTELDSNWLRTGLQSAASTASAFCAKEKLFFRGNNNYRVGTTSSGAGVMIMTRRGSQKKYSTKLCWQGRKDLNFRSLG